MGLFLESLSCSIDTCVCFYASTVTPLITVSLQYILKLRDVNCWFCFFSRLFSLFGFFHISIQILRLLETVLGILLEIALTIHIWSIFFSIAFYFIHLSSHPYLLSPLFLSLSLSPSFSIPNVDISRSPPSFRTLEIVLCLNSETYTWKSSFILPHFIDKLTISIQTPLNTCRILDNDLDHYCCRKSQRDMLVRFCKGFAKNSVLCEQEHTFTL